jgi:hypothetical protein
MFRLYLMNYDKSGLPAEKKNNSYAFISGNSYSSWLITACIGK